MAVYLGSNQVSGGGYKIPIQHSITLLANNWVGDSGEYRYINTVTVEGVTANNAIIVSPTSLHISTYVQFQIRCISQSTNSLSFAVGPGVQSAPTSAITVNVVIL